MSAEELAIDFECERQRYLIERQLKDRIRQRLKEERISAAPVLAEPQAPTDGSHHDGETGAASDIPNTEQRSRSQCPAVDGGIAAPKGLGTDGYKPLMRNRETQGEVLRDRDTAGHIFNQVHVFPKGRWT